MPQKKPKRADNSQNASNTNENDSPTRERGLDYDYEKSMLKPLRVDWTSWALMALVVVISVVGYPSFNPREKPTVHEVFYYGWMTAVSTGFGVIPFLIFR